jgi:phosphopantetheinyl transferase
MTEIFIVDVETVVPDSILEELQSQISVEKQYLAGKYKHKTDRKRCVYSEALVRYLACRKLNAENRHIRFAFNRYGKPYFQDLAGYYNLSHSGKWVVCAWSDREVGIDVVFVATDGDTALDALHKRTRAGTSTLRREEGSLHCGRRLTGSPRARSLCYATSKGGRAWRLATFSIS